MRTLAVTVAVLLIAALLGAGSAHSAPHPDGRAVVIVSGGAAVSPFTTPERACTSGLAAGNTDTALREYLLGHGYRVFTSPAMAGRGPVVDQAGFGAFGDCAVTLSDVMTVDSTGSIDLAGEHLARFLTHLHDEYSVRELDMVGHSMGGLYSRAAFRVLQHTGSALRIRSLTTIGTPWQGSYLSDYANGITPRSDCLGDAFCESAMDGMKAEVDGLMTGSGREVNQRYLMGPNGWNEFQAGVLDDIPVTLIAGDRFTRPGPVNPRVWPNDGIVAASSALAVDVSDRVLTQRRCFTFDDTHSIYVSNEAGLPWETGLTWDPRVHDVVRTALEGALPEPNRTRC
ncbi:alpha/beta hydrolase [Mycobacterium sp. SMC-8]|uniref:alpha/beta hydrolase n=1 Tax=Mycobacterium sp. SMC-8 TaxID=2857060 RepID=UPI0021B18DBD|nr:alpha/beta hydrolase [Mycobacterium sp. SMC-8]UXA14836.1 alpha/beta hydrolase [Mycobacterium sp. SMC-8]